MDTKGHLPPACHKDMCASTRPLHLPCLPNIPSLLGLNQALEVFHCSSSHCPPSPAACCPSHTRIDTLQATAKPHGLSPCEHTPSFSYPLSACTPTISPCCSHSHKPFHTLHKNPLAMARPPAQLSQPLQQGSDRLNLGALGFKETQGAGGEGRLPDEQQMLVIIGWSC